MFVVRVQYFAMKVFAVVVVLCLSTTASAQNFEIQSRNIVLMGDLFHGGSGQPVIFDAAAARKRGFSEDSIRLAEQMAAATNDLIVAADRSLKSLIPPDVRQQAADVQQKVDINSLDLDLTSYPELSMFLDNAQQYRGQLASLPKEQQDASQQAKALALEGQGILDFLNPYKQCGFFDNPLPPRAKDRVYYSSKDAVATLRGWGYHDDPLALRIGAGWTRARTYKWWICGWDTFRDNANPVSKTRLWEQNYSGWDPPGEPNPEVWRTGPWPYALWPLYVKWWHNEH